MKKEFADKWIADLLNPENKQTNGKLFDGDGYCCLGRAVVVSGRKFRYSMMEEGYVIDRAKGIYGEILSPAMVKEMGLLDDSAKSRSGIIVINGRTYTTLAQANDDGCTFEQIANWIEKNWQDI